MGFKQFLTNNLRIINSNNWMINRCANPVLDSQNIGYAQKAIVNTQDWPLKPKKPSPPFFQFLQEKRIEVAEKHDLKFKDAVRVVSEMWKSYDENTKKKMTEIYNQKLEQYKEGMKTYKQSLSDDQKNELFRLKYEQLEQKTRRKFKKELKDLGKPRKPLSGYIIFVSQEIKNRGNQPVHEYMKTIGIKWNEMDKNNKAKYFEMAAAENDKYNDALLNWENEMIKAGRFDLVRTRPISDNTDN